MIPLAFDYEVAESVDHAIELLGQHGEEAKLLAGGHSLLPIMKLRLAAPAVLVDLGRLEDLKYVRDEGDHIAVGAMTRHTDVEHNQLLQEQCGLLAYTTSLVGDPQVRHRGTIGGSISHGDAAVIEGSDGAISSARIGLTNMGSTPLRATVAEGALSGADASSVAEATQNADEGTSPASDIAASSEYRRHLARVLSRRAVEEALSR